MLKHLMGQLLIIIAVFTSCGRNREKVITTKNLVSQDTLQVVSSAFPPIVYDSDSIPVFYMGQDVYGADVEAPPTFNGGHYQDFGIYVSQQLSQTKVKAKAGNRGLVMVKFIVDYTGEVSFARAVLSDDPVLEAEAIRIIKSSPKWEPAKMNGKDANLVVTWPLRFAH